TASFKGFGFGNQTNNVPAKTYSIERREYRLIQSIDSPGQMTLSAHVDVFDSDFEIYYSNQPLTILPTSLILRHELTFENPAVLQALAGPYLNSTNPYPLSLIADNSKILYSLTAVRAQIQSFDFREAGTRPERQT